MGHHQGRQPYLQQAAHAVSIWRPRSAPLGHCGDSPAIARRGALQIVDHYSHVSLLQYTLTQCTRRRSPIPGVAGQSADLRGRPSVCSRG